MYDLHCHILPGIDDGPPDWSASLALAQTLVDEGVTHVAATPHGPGSNQSKHYVPHQLRDLVAQLREYLQRMRLPLKVVLGTEIVINSDLVAQLRDNVVLGYASCRAVLLETPAHIVMQHLERTIYDLQLAGYRIVLAHPERTRVFQDNPNLLLPLIERGVVVQVTSASLVGLHGERLRQIASQMVTHRLAQVIASDAHAATGARAPAMRAAYLTAAHLIGEAAAHQMVYAMPQSLLCDKPLPSFEAYPIQPQKQRWWQWR